MNINLLKHSIVFSLLILFFGCATNKVYYNEKVLSAQNEPSSTVYFFRQDTFLASGRSTQVLLNGALLVELKRGTYTKLNIKPDVYKIEIVAAAKTIGWTTSVQEIEFKKDDTYYILLMHGGANRKRESFFIPHFTTKEEAQKLIDSYKIVN